MSRKLPNILITGTPGTGKTSTAELVAENTGFNHINVSNFVKERGFYSERDEEYDSLVIDEDAVSRVILICCFEFGDSCWMKWKIK
jgi:adenylate kinase